MESEQSIQGSFRVLVFPLPRMVFFPGTTKPLNLFEPRHIKMVGDALETDRPVALAFAEPARLSEGVGRQQNDWLATNASPASLGVRRVAGIGRPVILDARPDGTLLVLFEALGKVHLGKRIRGDEPYLTCEASWIDEANSLERENVFILNRVNKEFTRWLEANVADREQLEIFLNQLTTPFEKINYLCSLMIHDPEAQQRLLETDDINDRLRVINHLIEERHEHLHA